MDVSFEEEIIGISEFQGVRSHDGETERMKDEVLKVRQWG